MSKQVKGQAPTKHKDVVRNFKAALVHARLRREYARIRREASHNCLFFWVDVLTQSLKKCCLRSGKHCEHLLPGRIPTMCSLRHAADAQRSAPHPIAFWPRQI